MQNFTAEQNSKIDTAIRFLEIRFDQADVIYNALAAELGITDEEARAAAAARYNGTTDEEAAPAPAAACDYCGARAGDRCVTATGRPATRPHAARTAAPAPEAPAVSAPAPAAAEDSPEAAEEEFRAVLSGAVEACLWSTMPTPADEDIAILETADQYTVTREEMNKLRGTLAHHMSGWFVENYATLLRATDETYTWEHVGHDFWLTSQGHGAGFWDRDLGEVGDALTDSVDGYTDIVGLYLNDEATHVLIDPYNVLDFNDKLFAGREINWRPKEEKMTATYDNEMLCSDCTMYVVNRDDSGNSEGWDKEALLRNLSNFRYSPADGTEDFSTEECGGCGTGLAGYRHEFSVEPLSALRNDDSKEK